MAVTVLSMSEVLPVKFMKMASKLCGFKSSKSVVFCVETTMSELKKNGTPKFTVDSNKFFDNVYIKKCLSHVVHYCILSAEHFFGVRNLKETHSASGSKSKVIKV